MTRARLADANDNGKARPALKCLPWQHEYTHWEIANDEHTGTPYVSGSKYQRRRCLRCGKWDQEYLGRRA